MRFCSQQVSNPEDISAYQINYTRSVHTYYYLRLIIVLKHLRIERFNKKKKEKAEKHMIEWSMFLRALKKTFLYVLNLSFLAVFVISTIHTSAGTAISGSVS